MNCYELIEKLYKYNELTSEEYLFLITNRNLEYYNILSKYSRELKHKYYQNKIFIRGLIEFSNYCKNNCYYCGIRNDNSNINRYRLSKSQIYACCEEGYKLGIKTFVLQSGEDLYFTDADYIEIIKTIKKNFNDVCITFSIGEKNYDSYKKYFDAGIERYLLRHETFNTKHYKKLHPENLSDKNRKQCLLDLKKIGYQVGAGFMVGSPFQTYENIVEDILFLKKLKPAMIGIGPFISHHDTPFKNFKNGDVFLTLFIIAITRLTLPYTLIPSTTALSTLNNNNYIDGILAGSNVIMLNLTKEDVRNNYMLYDNKKITNINISEYLKTLNTELKKYGEEIVLNRGDVYGYKN